MTFAEYGKFLPHAHILRDLRAVNLEPLEAKQSSLSDDWTTAIECYIQILTTDNFLS